MSKQPDSTKQLSREEFNRIRESMKYRKKAEQPSAGGYIPIDMGLFLTSRCNLRCLHCFEWNKDGFMTTADPSCREKEIPLQKIVECLEYTEPAKTRLYLWGGEPLLYSQFHELCMLLKKHQRWTTVCTNGLLIDRHLEDLFGIGDQTVLLISLDGFQEYNDKIRGKGTFDKVISNIHLFQKEKYPGEISVCTVISDAMIGHLYDFCEYMDTLDINTLYLSFPWYINEETASLMDQQFQNRFGDILACGTDASWHHFTWHISEELIDPLRSEMKRISEKRWNIRIRFQPALEPEEIDDFILGGRKTAQERQKCLAVFNRIDILENGEVSACKLFREFTVGNIHEKTIQELWEGEKMAEIRSRMSCGLLPVCSKCVLLYLNGE